MSDLQFLRTLAECSTDEAADLVESYDGYDMLDEDFDEYGDLTEAFFKKSDDKQKKKAETIGNKMVQYLNQGNQKKANKEAAKLTKILKLKPIKLPAPIMSALKKCTDSMNQVHAKIYKATHKSKNESADFDYEDFLEEGCGDDTMDEKGLDPSDLNKKIPQRKVDKMKYDLQRKGEQRYGRTSMKDESYAGLRSIAEGSTTWSDMHSQAQQFGTARPGAGFDDWEDDSCPYTGEPEEMDGFPRGGNFSEFEGLNFQECCDSIIYPDTDDLRLFEAAENGYLDESAGYDISECDFQAFCESYCNALANNYVDVLVETAEEIGDSDEFSDFADTLEESFSALLVEAAYAMTGDENLIDDDYDEAVDGAVAQNRGASRLQHAAATMKRVAGATGAKASSAAKYATAKARQTASSIRKNVGTKAMVARDRAAIAGQKVKVRARALKRNATATANRAAAAANRKIHMATLKAKNGIRGIKSSRAVAKMSDAQKDARYSYNYDSDHTLAHQPGRNREERRKNGERGMSNFGRKKRLHADAADEYDFEMVEECVADPVAFSGFLSETFD